MTIEWDLSNRCVLGCQDCHFAHTHVKGPWASRSRLLPMAYESTGDLADSYLVKYALVDMQNAGVKGIIWSGGGEPTTHPEYMDIVDYTHRLGLQQGMYTLGGLLTEDTARQLGERLTWVVVSLDAADAQTYAAEKHVPESRFEDALNGIRWLAAADCVVVGVSFLLHRDNWREAMRMYAVALDNGADYVTFRPAIRTNPQHPSVVSDDRTWVTEARGLLELLADDPQVECSPERFLAYRDWQTHGYDTCHGVKLTATVTPDGRVWICPQRRGVTALGDLRTESFTDIWARHAGRYTVDSGCRAMCRLHLMNRELAPVFETRTHEAFV